ncbi:MAG: M56 family metallopeptidase [Planctomycetaceae bacterium]|nr:M56 family metallopeptidase [Planctomycetaceae bacterium]
MLRLLEWSIANSVTVLLLMPVVFTLGRISRQPAVRHGLWILLLIKLVTPPLVPVSWDGDFLARLTAGPSSISQPVRISQTASPENAVVVRAAPVFPHLPDRLVIEAVDSSRKSAAGATSTMPAFSWLANAQGALQSLPWGVWGGWLLRIWATGSAAILLVQSARVFAFSRRLRRAVLPSDSLAEQLNELRESLGCPTAPRAVLVEGVVSPMLWGVGPWATILFPRDLFRKLDPQSRSTLLLHEMAHFYRGDHWVRLLEFVTSTLFWWHPVVWCSLREIEASEEQCCDNWVLQRTPLPPRCYADALLDTIDFLCEQQRALPVAASGLGNPRELRGRLVRIMQHSQATTINPAGRVLLLAFACLLPLQWQALDAFGRGVGDSFRGIEAVVPRIVEPAVEGSAATAEPPAADRSAFEVSRPVRRAAPPSRERPAATLTVPRSDRSDWATAISADARFQIVAKTGRRVELRDVDTDRRVPLDQWNIAAAAFIPGRSQFVTGGYDREVRLWDAPSGRLLRNLGRHGDAVVTVTASPDGRTVAAGSRDGRLALYDVATGTLIQDWELGEAVSCARFSPDRLQLLITTGHWRSEDPGRLFVLPLKTGNMGHPLVITKTAGAIDFTSDSSVVVLGSWDGLATYVRLADGSRLAQVPTFKDWISASAFSANAAHFSPLTLEEARFEEQRLLRESAERAEAARLAAQQVYMLFDAFVTPQTREAP